MPTIRSSAGSSSRNRPQGNLLYDEPTGGFKKRRLGRACDMCRQKKIRCDRTVMPGNICSNCVSFNVECTYRRTAPEAGSSYSAIALQCLVEEILSSSIPYPVPEEKDAIRKMVVDLATYARKLETRIHSLAQSLAKFYPELECKCPCDEPVDDGVEWLSDFLGNVSVSDHEGPFLGKSSTLSLVKLAWNTNNTYRPEEVDHSNDGGLCHQAELIDAMAESLTMRGPYSSAEHRQLEFPPYEMILNLTDVYFNHISIIVPFLHGPTFKRRLLQGFHLRDKEFGGLVLSVCACAALINPPNPKTSSQVSTETIMAWYDQFDPTSMNFLRPMSLYQLQTILNCIILIPFWLPNWTILFNTIRHVQGIGIHRKQWYDQQKISSTEKELWKRAFWILVAYDIYMADYFGRTATLVPEDYDLDVPIDCDDDYWPGERPGDTGRDFQQPEGKPSTIAHWLSSLHLLTIYRYSQRTIYAIRRPQFIVGDDPTWRSKVVSQLDSAMNKWVNKMPAHLRWDPKATDVHVLALGDRDSAERHRIIEVQKTALHLTFYCMQIQIHYPLMDKTPGTSHGGSHVHLIICVNAARSCVHLLDMYSQKYKIPPVSHIFARILRLTLILVFSASSRKLDGLDSNGSATDISCLHKCVQILRRFEGSWQVTEGSSVIIQCLIDKCSKPGQERVKTADGKGLEGEASAAINLSSLPSADSHSESLRMSMEDQNTLNGPGLTSNLFNTGLDAFSSSLHSLSSSSFPWDADTYLGGVNMDDIFHPMPSISTQPSDSAYAVAHLDNHAHAQLDDGTATNTEFFQMNWSSGYQGRGQTTFSDVSSQGRPTGTQWDWDCPQR